jgi:hypothetical protein
MSPDAPVDDPGTDIAAVPAGCAPDRSLTDRSDDHGYDQIRVIYVTPSDGADLARDTSGQICNSVRAFATWFHARSGAYLRFDTASNGLVDIGFVRLSATDAEMKGTDPGNTTIETGIAFVRERIERELANRAMIAPNKAYAVYYEGSSARPRRSAWPHSSPRASPRCLHGVLHDDRLRRPSGAVPLAPGYTDYAMPTTVRPASSPTAHRTTRGASSSCSRRRHRAIHVSPQTNDPPWDICAGWPLARRQQRRPLTRRGAGHLDLASSSLLAPLAPNARRPIGW